MADLDTLPFLTLRVHPLRRNWSFRSESKWASLRMESTVWSQLLDPGCTKDTCVCFRVEKHWISLVSHESRTPN